MLDLTGLPGEDLVKRGQLDLVAGEVTIAAMLVSVARDRLRSLGVDLKPLPGSVAPYVALQRIASRARQFSRSCRRAPASRRLMVPASFSALRRAVSPSPTVRKFCGTESLPFV